MMRRLCAATTIAAATVAITALPAAAMPLFGSTGLPFVFPAVAPAPAAAPTKPAVGAPAAALSAYAEQCVPTIVEDLKVWRNQNGQPTTTWNDALAAKSRAALVDPATKDPQATTLSLMVNEYDFTCHSFVDYLRANQAQIMPGGTVPIGQFTAGKNLVGVAAGWNPGESMFVVESFWE